MGKPWENHGKTMGKPWENMGVSICFNGIELANFNDSVQLVNIMNISPISLLG